MTYRFLSLKDAPVLAQIFEQNFPDGWNLSQLESAFNQQGFYALGCFEQDLVGFITYALVYDVADINDLLVLPNYRKKGYALALIRECEKHLKNLGAQKLMLEVRKSNMPAINLYKKVGLEQICERKKYYSNGEDALVFQKELL